MWRRRRSDDPEKFASDMNLVRRHPLFPALIHTGNENSKVGWLRLSMPCSATSRADLGTVSTRRAFVRESWAICS